MSKGAVIFGGVILAGAFLASRGNAQTQQKPVLMPAVEKNGFDKLRQYAPLINWGVDQMNVGSKTIKKPNIFQSLLASFTGSSANNEPKLNATYEPINVSYNASDPSGYGFAAKENQYGLPRGYLQRTAEIESNLNPNAQNPRSSAGGLFQFIDSTARAYGLNDRFNGSQATDAASRLGRDNSRQLRRALGRDPTGGELYLAHQQGGGGASRLLRDRSRPAVEVVGVDAVRLNGGASNMTSGQFADLWINKFNRGA